MASVLRRNRKLLTRVAVLGGFAAAVDWQSCGGLSRGTRSLIAGARIINAYKFSDASEMEAAHELVAQLILDTCATNGGLYVKFGQGISAMNHILPPVYSEKLAALHDQAPHVPFSVVSKVIRESFGVNSVSDVFDDFEPTPIGSASIAQVHRARLKSNGQVVAVKIVKPEIRYQMGWDINCYKLITLTLEKLFHLPLYWSVDFTEQQLRKEVDLVCEAENGEKCAETFKDMPNIHIPKVYRELCNKSVLTAEWIDGVKYEARNVQLLGISKAESMKALCECFGQQIFKHGFVHADPHPGNVLIRYKQNSSTPAKREEGRFDDCYDPVSTGLALRDAKIQQGDNPDQLEEEYNPYVASSYTDMGEKAGGGQQGAKVQDGDGVGVGKGCPLHKIVGGGSSSVKNTKRVAMGREDSNTVRKARDTEEERVLADRKAMGTHKTARKNADFEIVLLDHGMYVYETPEFQRQNIRMWEGIVKHNPAQVEEVVREWGVAETELFVSLNMFRPYKPNVALSRNVRLAKEEILAQAKEKVKRMLEDTRKLPVELVFVIRSMNLVRFNNRAMGSPVNRVQLLATCALQAARGQPRPGVVGFLAWQLSGLALRARLFALAVSLETIRLWKALTTGSSKVTLEDVQMDMEKKMVGELTQ